MNDHDIPGNDDDLLSVSHLHSLSHRNVYLRLWSMMLTNQSHAAPVLMESSWLDSIRGGRQNYLSASGDIWFPDLLREVKLSLLMMSILHVHILRSKQIPGLNPFRILHLWFLVANILVLFLLQKVILNKWILKTKVLLQLLNVLLKVDLALSWCFGHRAPEVPPPVLWLRCEIPIWFVNRL